MMTYLKKEERKKQIKDSALKLFAKRGYANTSIKDILADIGYSKGGFYNCYSSKLELFQELLQDGMDYRLEKVSRYKEEMKDLDRETFLIEALLDKLLDENPYKKLFVRLSIEMNDNDDLKKVHELNMQLFTQIFIDFCNEQGFDEYVSLSDINFGIFINSMILGANVFGVGENKEYRDMLRVMLRAYFKEIGLIK